MKPALPTASLPSRWWFIAMFGCVGALLCALPAPSRVEEQATSYDATHTLLVSGTDSLAVAESSIVLFATIGEVPERVAVALDYDGSSGDLSAEVSVAFDPDTRALTFTTTQDTAEAAEQLVDRFAELTLAYIAQVQDAEQERRILASQQRLHELEIELDAMADRDALADQVAYPRVIVVERDREAIAVQLELAYEQVRQLESDVDRLTLTTLGSAGAVPNLNVGLNTPADRPTRAMIGLVTGAFVGAISWTISRRLDLRIRSHEQAEEILGIRAQALLPDAHHKGIVLRAGDGWALPNSYRTLRNVLTSVQQTMPQSVGARVTVVASPGTGDGRTLVSANLVAAFAEVGEQVLAANGDFRRTGLHLALTGYPRGPLPIEVDDLENADTPGLMEPTVMSRVNIVDFGSVDASPGERARALALRLDDLRSEFDQIVIDTSPLATTAEVLELLPHADTIVLVTRIGHTSLGATRRAAAILEDVATAPIVLAVTGTRANRSKVQGQGDPTGSGTSGTGELSTLEVVE